MEQFLKKVNLDPTTLRFAYLLGREQGRKFLKGALIVPGIRINDLTKIAKSQNENPQTLIEKRDSMLEAMIDFIEALVNLDEE
jgi:hypothetical protein